MQVTVKYFASLKEELGRSGDTLDVSDGDLTVALVWHQASGRAEMPANVLCAVNLEYVGPEHTVCDGDEVAFFPPVTGG